MLRAPPPRSRRGASSLVFSYIGLVGAIDKPLPARNRLNADRKADVVGAVAEGRARDARDTCPREDTEDILPLAALAPVVDRAAIVQVDALEELMLLVQPPQL